MLAVRRAVVARATAQPARAFSAAREVVASKDAPAAIGPYSQAIKANGFVFVSGCLGLVPSTGKFPSDTDVVAQTEVALQNMKAVLTAAGSGMDQVVKTTVMLATIDDYPKVNEVYGKHFTGTFPARSAFAVKTLPRNGLVEIECIATYSAKK